MNKETKFDKYYEEAKTLAREKKKISASFFQRRLDIGFPQANLIVEKMQEEGFDKEIYPELGYEGEQKRLSKAVDFTNNGGW